MGIEVLGREGSISSSDLRMSIPAKYQWLANVGTLPRTIAVGLECLGVKEIVGRGSNRTIIAWRDELNAAGVKISGYSDDDIPWCGLFAAWVTFQRASNAQEVVDAPLWARNWATYGRPTKQAALGDVLVFGRNGGGHVGFYVGEDQQCFHVLGGNQSNAVTIARIKKSRLIAVRRPPYNMQPASVTPYFVSATGTISTNES